MSSSSQLTARGLSKPITDGLYAPLMSAGLGNNTVFWGDSLTQSSDQPYNLLRGMSWPVFASIISNQQIRYIYNAGIAGNLTRQILARWATDVAPYQPQTVTIMGGTNDFLSGCGVGEVTANLKIMVGLVRSIGAVPVMCTIPPNATVGGMNAKIDRLNYWIARYAADNGINIIDFHSLLTDPTTNTYKSTYVSDGTHPNVAGYLAMANLAVTTLAQLMPAGQPFLPVRNLEDANLLYGGCFATDANSDGVADYLTHIAATSGVTDSLSAATVGKWQTQTASSSTGVDVLYQTLAVPPVAGHRYRFVGRVNATPWTAGTYKAYLRFTGTGVDAVAINNFNAPIAGVFVIEMTAPGSSTSVSARFEVGAGSTGTVQWGQVGVYDLTDLGLA